jgi:hypothetical protein
VFSTAFTELSHCSTAGTEQASLDSHRRDGTFCTETVRQSRLPLSPWTLPAVCGARLVPAATIALRRAFTRVLIVCVAPTRVKAHVSSMLWQWWFVIRTFGYLGLFAECMLEPDDDEVIKGHRCYLSTRWYRTVRQNSSFVSTGSATFSRPTRSQLHQHFGVLHQR